jgi:hypothetical protein
MADPFVTGAGNLEGVPEPGHHDTLVQIEPLTALIGHGARET